MKKYIVLIVMSFFLIVGCGQKKSEEMSSNKEHQHGTMKMEKAKSGVADVNNTVCPVMGGKTDPKYNVVYKGKRYVFCCPECIGKFNKDPEKYIKKIKKGEKVTSHKKRQHEMKMKKAKD